MPTPSEPRRDDVARLVRDVVATILPQLPPEEITGDRRLTDLGTDSIDRAEIILRVMEHLDLAEPMWRFDPDLTIDGLVGVFHTAAVARS